MEGTGSTCQTRWMKVFDHPQGDCKSPIWRWFLQLTYCCSKAIYITSRDTNVHISSLEVFLDIPSPIMWEEEESLVLHYLSHLGTIRGEDILISPLLAPHPSSNSGRPLLHEHKVGGARLFIETSCRCCGNALGLSVTLKIKNFRYLLALHQC